MAENKATLHLIQEAKKTMTNLEPGAELNAKVAKALGWKFVSVSENNPEVVRGIPPWSPINWCTSDHRDYSFIDPYSTDVGKAIESLEEFCKKRGLRSELRYYPGMNNWLVSITDGGKGYWVVLKDSLAHAISSAITISNEMAEAEEASR